jgi:hypothetical protein
MKIITLITIACILSCLTALRNKSKNLGREKTKDSPKIMNDVIYRKSIPIKSLQSNNAHHDSRFKELDYVPKNLESPQIVPSLGFGPKYDLKGRVARTYDQKIDNLVAFDVLYKDHHDYYDKDKKYYVLDNHFQQTEEYLLGKFSQAIKEGVQWDSKLKHVDDYQGKVDINLTNVPRINPDAVRTSMNYGELAPGNNGVMRASSDPYSDMFGSRDK